MIGTLSHRVLILSDSQTPHTAFISTVGKSASLGHFQLFNLEEIRE